MPTHAYHQGLDGYVKGAVLQDGCEVCEERAKSLRGLLHLDPERIERLWDLMLDWRYSGGEHKARIGEDASHAEAQATVLLYHMALILERTTAVNPWLPLTQLTERTER